MYKVLNGNHVYVKVSDADIENYVVTNLPLEREIITAMGMTHKKEYLELLYPYLHHENYFIRRSASQSIFLIDGSLGLDELMERENIIPDEDFMKKPSEKACLQAMIIYIKFGVEGAREYFFSEEGSKEVKYSQLMFYSSGYQFKEEDIKYNVILLNSFAEKRESWIIKLSRGEYLDFIFTGIQNIYIASVETEVLQNISSSTSNQICELFDKLCEVKVDTDTMEMMVDISRGLQREYGLKVLSFFKGRTRGDAKKAYKKALKFWGVLEDAL